MWDGDKLVSRRPFDKGRSRMGLQVSTGSAMNQIVGACGASAGLSACVRMCSVSGDVH